MKNILFLLILCLFTSCRDMPPKKQPSLKDIICVECPYITGGQRNGIQSMEGLDFTINKKDTNALDYRFSIVNWRDKFEDITGTMQLDSSTLFQDTFFIETNANNKAAAYKFMDNSKKYPLWVAFEKREHTYQGVARFFQVKGDSLEELSSLLYAK